MKTLLYFIPFNIMKNNAGAHTRAWELLRAFHENGITVDYVHSTDTWGAPMSEQEFAAMQETGLVRHIYSLQKKPKGFADLGYSIRYRVRRFFRDLLFQRALPDFVTPYNQHQFDEILKQHRYDYIVISYAYWADLIKNNPLTQNARLIIDTHDFLTAQERVWKKFKIGRAFSREMNRLGYFDQVWAISAEEQYLFRQFVDKEVKLIPFCLQEPSVPEGNERDFDVIYVAGNNRHNIKAAHWFFEAVYPLLQPSVRVCVIGGIHKYIPDGENIQKFPHVTDLGSYYSRAKLAICPMLSGTGVKIKVIEALAYRLPVVCSPRGVDGLVNKTKNGCVVVESAKHFEGAIRRLLNDPAFFRETQDQAISFFRENHSWEKLIQIVTSEFI